MHLDLAFAHVEHASCFDCWAATIVFLSLLFLSSFFLPLSLFSLFNILPVDPYSCRTDLYRGSLRPGCVMEVGGNTGSQQTNNDH